MKAFRFLGVGVIWVSFWVVMGTGSSLAQEKFSTFAGNVIGIRAKLWLDVERETDKTVMNFRIGRRTVYTPRRYPTPGEKVKVEYQVSRGVPVAFTVTIIEKGKEGSGKEMEGRSQERQKGDPVEDSGQD